MRRLLLSLTLALACVAGPSSPAEAHVDSCSGTGVLTLAAGLGTYKLTAVQSTALVLDAPTATCLTTTGFSASGTLTGWCGLTYGYGTTSDGHSFGFTTQTGGSWSVTAEVIGTASVTPNVLTGGSCLTNSATSFIVNFSVNLSHGGALLKQPLHLYCDTTTTDC